MNGLKFLLQDIAYLIAVYLILGWTGAKFEWFHWLIIAVALMVMNLYATNRGMNFTIDYFLNREPCDNPDCKSCTERKAKV